jgi:hypothetical protein
LSGQIHAWNNQRAEWSVRARAVEDGVLIDMSETAREEGIRTVMMSDED